METALTMPHGCLAATHVVGTPQEAFPNFSMKEWVDAVVSSSGAKVVSESEELIKAVAEGARRFGFGGGEFGCGEIWAFTQEWDGSGVGGRVVSALPVPAEAHPSSLLTDRRTPACTLLDLVHIPPAARPCTPRLTPLALLLPPAMQATPPLSASPSRCVTPPSRRASAISRARASSLTALMTALST